MCMRVCVYVYFYAVCSWIHSAKSIVLNLSLLQAALSNLWPKTVGFWDLTLPSSFFGTVHAPLSTIEGGCSERYATHTSPASTPDITSLFGTFTLVPPLCKGGLPEWETTRQPSLLYPVRAGSGISFRPGLTPGGLALSKNIRELHAANVLPAKELTIEMFVSFDRDIPPGTQGGLFDGMHRAPAFFGRGVSIYWKSTNDSGVIELSMSLSNQKTDHPVRGGITTVHTPPMPIYNMTGGGYIYVAGMYNETHISIYVNKTLAASQPACASPPCGAITWPVKDKVSDTDSEKYNTLRLSASPYVYMTLGYVEGAPHWGGLATARVIRGALSERQIEASSARNMNTGAIAKGVPKCPPGTEGPYDGEEPCTPCDPGVCVCMCVGVCVCV